MATCRSGAWRRNLKESWDCRGVARGATSREGSDGRVPGIALAVHIRPAFPPYCMCLANSATGTLSLVLPDQMGTPECDNLPGQIPAGQFNRWALTQRLAIIGPMWSGRPARPSTVISAKILSTSRLSRTAPPPKSVSFASPC
jgi:hypothetical protein